MVLRWGGPMDTPTDQAVSRGRHPSQIGKKANNRFALRECRPQQAIELLTGE